MNFYSAARSGNGLQQGDLLVNVPFTYFSASDAQVFLADGQGASRDLTQNNADVVGVAAKVEFAWGLALSQTCDLQADSLTGAARKPILVARVLPVKELIPSFKEDTVKNAVSAVRTLATAGNAPTTFYLPAFSGEEVSLPRCAANLLDVQRFPAYDLPALTRLFRLRLESPALQSLQERCAYCFGRFAAPDDLFYSAEEQAEIVRQTEARQQR